MRHSLMRAPHQLKHNHASCSRQSRRSQHKQQHGGMPQQQRQQPTQSWHQLLLLTSLILQPSSRAQAPRSIRLKLSIVLRTCIEPQGVASRCLRHNDQSAQHARHVQPHKPVDSMCAIPAAAAQGKHATTQHHKQPRPCMQAKAKQDS
jgi:hypothetical protein